MSKIALVGNATGSGTLSIEAPSTNTDRTFTLPDTDGTVVTTAGATFSGAVTFSGGISGNTNVTGTVTAGTNGNIQLYDANLRADSTLYIGTTNASGGALQLYTDDKNRMLLAGNGDISFYEDTGTTPKLFWDASAESLGIDTTSPDAFLQVGAGARGANAAAFQPTLLIGDRPYGDGNANLEFSPNLTTGNSVAINVDSSKNFKIGNYTSGSFSETMRIDSSGNVGIGTTSPSGLLDLRIPLNSQVGFVLSYNDTYPVGGITAQGSTGEVRIGAFNTEAGSTYFPTFYSNNSEAMRIDSSGRVGIGTTSPAQKLTVASEGRLRLYRSDNTRYADLYNDNFFLNITTSTDPIKIDGQSYVRFDINNTEKMRITSSGKVGIGTSSPVSPLSISTTSDTADLGSTGLVIGGTSTSGDVAMINFTPNGASSNRARAGVGCVTGTDWGKGNLTFYTRDASDGTAMTTADERMRIDSSGRLLVGTTTHTINGGHHFSTNEESFDRTTINLGHSRNDGGGVTLFRAYFNSTLVGQISATNSSTSFVTSSDYRLKEDWVPMSDSIARVKALNPVNFAWKVDGTRVDGFLAHEAQEVVPEAVTGTKDAVDDEGNPDYQGIDQAKLVPLLTAALQEAISRIETLEAEVQALKSE